jgi:hypothetical protein
MTRLTLKRAWIWAPLFAAGSIACYDAPVGSPPPGIVEDPAINVSAKNKVDLLFMVDNSPSMLPMQTELKQKLKTFFDAFTAAAAQQKYADLHIGVVTSDFGASGADKAATKCDPFGGGQSGKLQALGAAHDQGCLPPVGGNFIAYNFDPAQAGESNLPPTQDLVTTFGCMAAVGAGGCGFEHQLESVFAALHNNLPENANFLRDDARLAIVFLTNEDDGSAPEDSHIYNTALANFGPLNTYRQTMWGVECGAPAMLTPDAPSMGELHGCAPAGNPADGSGPGKEFDVQRYIDFFTQPKLNGGVKFNPDDVILVGIDALYDDAQGLQIILASGSDPTTNDYVPCDVQSETPPRCEPYLQHSCHNPTQPAFFGDSAVRINTVIGKAKVNKVLSICDDDYAPALQAIADLLTDPPAGCVPDTLPSVTDPNCVVEDWTEVGNQPLQITEIPRCDQAPPGATCWLVEQKAACAKSSPQGVGVTVDRQGQDAPPDTFVNAHCSGIPESGGG